MSAPPSVVVHGRVERRFAPVAEAFADNFVRHGDVGAACCVYHRGRLVVDIWGGMADREAQRSWAEDTLQLVFSTTKGVTALCAHLLVERGELDLDVPVAEYWPEFGVNGKASIPVRWVLSHRAGLAVVEGDLTLEQVLAWHPVATALAVQAPNWEPGTAHGYHVRSYGWLIGEVVRRITGRSLGRFFADEVATPLGLDFWIGLPEAEEGRVATLYPPEAPSDPRAQDLMAVLMGPGTLLGRAMTGPSGLFRYDGMWNTRAIHAAEMPSSNGIGTARALATMYASLVGEVGRLRLLRPETVEAACVVQSEGTDKVLGFPMRFGLGFLLPPILSPGAGPQSFGHPGAGGSLAFADPEQEIAVAYVMNQMQLGLTGDRRAAGLVEAVYRSLV
jgi:CubicO group peptidase (beta-lactamase class C family)